MTFPVTITFSSKNRQEGFEFFAACTMGNAAAVMEMAFEEIKKQINSYFNCLLTIEKDATETVATKLTPFMAACLSGNISLVDFFCNVEKSRLEINKSNLKKSFYYACEIGNEKMVKLLINSCAEFFSPYTFSQRVLRLVDPTTESNNDNPLAIACRYNHIEVVRILVNHQKYDVNFKRPYRSPLEMACLHSSDEIFELLLTRDDIDVNVRNSTFMGSPFCYLIKKANFDNRDDTHTVRLKGLLCYIIKKEGLFAPFIQNDLEDLIKLLDKTCRPAISENNFCLKWLGNRGLAEEDTIVPIKTFLEVVDRAQEEAKRAVVRDYSAQLFALVVFLSDGLLCKKTNKKKPGLVRFFSMAERLPLDLQMVLCNKAASLNSGNIPIGDNIRTIESEPAFKELATHYRNSH
jgi:ankyrin repeat protein